MKQKSLIKKKLKLLKIKKRESKKFKNLKN